MMPQSKGVMLFIVINYSCVSIVLNYAKFTPQIVIWGKFHRNDCKFVKNDFLVTNKIANDVIVIK